jgi:hypothetical protein
MTVCCKIELEHLEFGLTPVVVAKLATDYWKTQTADRMLDDLSYF